MSVLCAAFAAAYLLGSIPTAYLMVKRAARVDIRRVGSGNVGATNALRTAGPVVGAAVFVIDILKGVVAARWLPGWILGMHDPVLALACGLMAILGHNFPCFLNFQGGKGVATTIGVLLGTMPLVAGLVGLAWAAVFAATRYVSIASMVAAVAIPVGQAWAGQGRAEGLLGGCVAGLILLRHRSNVQRLLQGAEHRAFSARRKG